MDLSLRRAAEADIAFLMRAERGAGYDLLVGQSSETQHCDALADPTRVTLIGADASEDLGFVTCSGLADRHNGVCLQRVVAAIPDRGVGSALVPAVIDWVFAKTGAHRIWLDTLRHNARAQHLYEKLGFTRDGVFREAYQMPDGAYADRILYAVLKREWLDRKA